MRVSAIVFVVTCSIGFVTPSTRITRCKSGPLPIQSNINDCVIPPCKIPAGSLVVTSTEFVAVADADSLSGSVVYSHGDQKLAEIKSNNLCATLRKESCPVKKGKRYTIDFNTKEEDFPKGEIITVQTTVTDNKSNVEFCFKFTEIHV